MKKKDYQKLSEPLKQGELNEAGQLCGYPPKRIARIVKKLSGAMVVAVSGKRPAAVSEKLTDSERKALNKFAAAVAG